MICYCGFDYGICTGYLYSNYLLQGIAFNSLILIPCTLISIFGYLLLSREAFYFSLQLLRLTMPNAKNHSAWLAGEELRLTTYNRYDTEIRTSLRANVGSIFSDLQNKTSGAESKFEKTLSTQTSEFNRKV